MGLMLLAVDQGLAKFMMEEGLTQILFLAGLVVGGMAFYALSVLWLGIIDIKDMRRYLKRSDHKTSAQEDGA
jgi:hypothetical protein